MRIDFEGRPPIIIGKRITIGAAILGIVNALGHFYPQHAPAMLAVATPTIFVVQLLVANYFGVTTDEETK